MTDEINILYVCCGSDSINKSIIIDCFKPSNLLPELRLENETSHDTTGSYIIQIQAIVYPEGGNSTSSNYAKSGQRYQWREPWRQ